MGINTDVKRKGETISAASFRLTSSLASGGTFALTVGFRLAVFFGGFRPDAPAFSIANYGMATGISRSQLGWGLPSQRAIFPEGLARYRANRGQPGN